jgi:uncharacterized protein (DUF2236 family)
MKLASPVMPLAKLPDDDDALLVLAAIDPLPPAEEGLFRAGSWLRRINAEPALLFGGGRALLLEVAHPLVAAGVAEHSKFRTDPFGRLQRTLDAMGAIAFGDRAAALAAARSVERAHRRVRGTLGEEAGAHPAGSVYDGRDVTLVRWVWATLVDSALRVYECFVAPLTPEALEAYYADQCVIARLLGVPGPDLPASYAAFRVWFDDCVASDVLCVTSVAREIAEAVLAPPGGLADGGRVELITAALLPERLRDAFGLRFEAADRARFEALVRSVRSLREGTPEPVLDRRRTADLR